PAGQRRARGHDQLITAVEIDHGRRLNAILDLRRVGSQRRLEPDIHFGAARNLDATLDGTDALVARRVVAAAAIAIVGAVVAHVAVHETIEVIAQALTLRARHRLA